MRMIVMPMLRVSGRRVELQGLMRVVEEDDGMGEGRCMWEER